MARHFRLDSSHSEVRTRDFDELASGELVVLPVSYSKLFCVPGEHDAWAVQLVVLILLTNNHRSTGFSSVLSTDGHESTCLSLDLAGSP